MVHVSSASAQLLQLTDGHVNHSRYQNTPGLYNRPMFNLSKALFFIYIYIYIIIYTKTTCLSYTNSKYFFFLINIFVVFSVVVLYYLFTPNNYLCNFNRDYGSRAVRFSSITTTAGWSRKPQPLLNLHMHEQCRISISYHCLFV